MLPVLFAPVMLAINDILFWTNPKPNSEDSCFPIEFHIEKETFDLNRIIFAKTKLKLSEIPKYFETSIEGVTVSVELKVDPHFSMLDGQVSNHIYGNKDTQRCYICEKRLPELRECRHESEDGLRCNLGIKSLHSTLRIFDKILEISYKRGIRICSKNTEKSLKLTIGLENKAIIAANKKSIHKKFWDNLGIDVDRPKQGFGTTTTGKCAKVALENFECTSKILKFDKGLLEKINKLGKFLYSCDPINLDEFSMLTEQIKHDWLKLIPGENITPTIHIILDHGPKIIENLFLMPGLFTEEGLESTHKKIREIKLNLSRNCSRKDKIFDILKRLFFNAYVAFD